MNVASLVQVLASLFLLFFVGAVVVTVLRASRRQSTRGAMTLVITLGVLAGLLSSLSAGLVFIAPNERGVVVTAVSPGYRAEALQPGLNWILPFVENVVTYTVSKQTYTMSIATNEGQVQGDDSITARTRDGQELFIDASVLFAIDPAKVVQVHITWQNRYTDELIRPMTRGIIRDIISQYGVEEVVTSKRVEMTQAIADGIAQKLSENGLMLSDFLLRNITFSAEYSASIEQKQIAEQQAQQAKLVVESKRQEAEQARQVAQGAADASVIRAKGEADARIIQAQAEAQALELIAAALKQNQELLTYQYISKLAPGIQVMLVPSDNPYILPLPSIGPQTVTPTVEPAPAPTTTP